MRRAGGRVVLLLGVVLMIVGVAAAVAFGPDDRVRSQPQRLVSRGLAVITAPAAIGYSGPTIELTVTRKASDPVFLGVGYHVDVRDYLTGSTYTQIDSVDLTFDVATSDVKGKGRPDVGPEDLDWWLITGSGKGSATVTFPLPDAAVDIVVTDPGLRPGLDVTVTAAVVQQGAFVGGLALSVSGVGLAVVGRMLTSSDPASRLRRRTAEYWLGRRDKTKQERGSAA